MGDKEKIEKLISFDEKKYENVDLDHLMMYVIGKLGEIKADLSFENAVIAAFKIFPKKFSLVGYPEYPDSNRVDQCLWRCAKHKQWIGGKSRQGFTITERSKLIIKEAEVMLEKGIEPEKGKATSGRRRKEALLSEVENSSAYKKYSQGEGNKITEAELCFLLQGTLDSSRKLLEENLLMLKKFAKDLENQKIFDFTEWVETNFKAFFKKK
jgi:hypothetical protein